MTLRFKHSVKSMALSVCCIVALPAGGRSEKLHIGGGAWWAWPAHTPICLPSPIVSKVKSFPEP